MLNYDRKNNVKVSAMSDTLYMIYISEKAYMQMSYIIKNCNTEVGWLASVQRNGNTFEINECFLLDQDAHGATCELKEEALNDFAMELIQSDQIDLYESIKCWCHSHVNMSVSPSSQDTKQMELFSDNDYFIRGIGNKSGEMKFDIFDFKNGLLIEDIKWEVKRDENIINRIKLLKAELERLITIEDKKLEQDIIEQIKNKVKAMPISIPTFNTNYTISTQSKPYTSTYKDYSEWYYEDYIERAEKSIYDYIIYDEAHLKYEELDFEPIKMKEYLRVLIKDATEYELECFIDELDYEYEFTEKNIKTN